MWWSVMENVEPSGSPRVTPLLQRKRATSLSALSALLVACSAAPPQAQTAAAPPPPPIPTTVPVTAPTIDARALPPPSGLAPDWLFPAIKDTSEANGLGIRLVQRRSLPLVYLELVVKSGSASDEDKPGLAAVAGELLKAGGAGKWTGTTLVDAAESLGSSLDVTTDRDSTRITLAVTTEHFRDALDILAAVATKPRFDPGEFAKLKQREHDRVASLAKTSAGWAASMVLYRRLFELPSAVHPYSHFDATPTEIDAIKLADCKAWHAREFSPKNAFLVVAGDVEDAPLAEAVHASFGAWKGDAPEEPNFTAPVPPNALSIFLVDRPASAQAEVYVATLGPERKSPEWPVLRTTNQILGGGVTGRLFLDVREKRSLAYRTRSSVESLAHGPVPIVLSAGTQTAKTGLTLQALLEQFDGLTKNAPTDEETAIATRYLSDVFLVGVDTVGTIAGMTADLGIYGLPNDYYDTYRTAVRAVSKQAVFELSQEYFKPEKAIVVVAGDAARLTAPLSHFGAVQIVDAEHGFVIKSKAAQDPTAPIELPRINGT
jgi:predicted Zn-dependent peptidase